MKITDPKILRELYDTEAEAKLLIGYRFKGCLPDQKHDGHQSRMKRPGVAKRRKRISSQ
jgi:hypothetical protein